MQNRRFPNNQHPKNSKAAPGIASHYNTSRKYVLLDQKSAGEKTSPSVENRDPRNLSTLPFRQEYMPSWQIELIDPAS
jgi:hypothetical protein